MTEITAKALALAKRAMLQASPRVGTKNLVLRKQQAAMFGFDPSMSREEQERRGIFIVPD